MSARFSSSIGEAQASVSELATLVTQVLENNQEMSRRMASIEQRTFRLSPSSISTITRRDAVPNPLVVGSSPTEDNMSIVTIKGLLSDSQSGAKSEPIHTFGFSFDQDLNRSRPYTRAMKRPSVWSAASSEIHTMGWSCLSGISLSDVSQISVINLPIFLQEVWNGQRYSASRVEDSRVGLVLSKQERRPSISPMTTDRYASVPATTRSMSLLGIVSSTELGKHIQ